MQQALFDFFHTHNIEHTTVEHPALFTNADSHLVQGILPEPHSKNLFLKDDNKQFWLISALDSTKINLRQLTKALPAKNLRFAQAELLREHLGVEPGSVTWFALLNDKQQRVNALLDKAVFAHSQVGFHPLINTATTLVKPQDLLRFADALGHAYRVYDFLT